MSQKNGILIQTILKTSQFKVDHFENYTVSHCLSVIPQNNNRQPFLTSNILY
jgi:hypothetical protein